MPTLEEHMEAMINIFHQYSVLVGDADTLSKSETKKLITRELPNSIKNTNDQASIDRLFQDLDADGDGQLIFEEFLLLVSRLLMTMHRNIHKE